jgi:PAS domain S-box-containing protein
MTPMRENKPSESTGGELRGRAEARLRSEDGQTEDLSNGDLQRLVHELRVHQIELELQNEELREAHAELAQSRERYFDLYHYAPAGYVTVDNAGMILEANFTFCEMAGAGYELVVRKPFAAFIAQSDQQHFYNTRKQFFAEKGSRTQTLSLRQDKGGKLPVRMESCRIAGGQEKPRWRIIINDISEIEKARRALETSREDYRLLAENARDAIVECQRSGHIRYASPAFQTLLRYPRDKAPEGNIFDFVYPDDLPAVREQLRNLLPGQGSAQIEHRLTDYHGAPIQVETAFREYHRKDTRETGLVLGIRDIEARKQAREALEDRERFLQAVQDASNDGMEAIGPMNQVLWCNEVAAVFTGATAGGKAITRHRLSDNRESRAIRAEIFSGGQPRDYESRVRGRDGRDRVLWFHAVPMRGPDGEISAVLECSRDITDRKEAEIELRRLAAVVNSADDAVITKNLDGFVTSWNASAERIYGYSAEEAIGRHISFLVPDDQQDEWNSIMEDLRQGRKLQHFETRRQRKDGRLIDVSITLSPVRDEHDRLVAWSGISRDITEQKRIAERLTHATKIESLAVMAGGIAHDFNNLLHSILGFTALARESYEDRESLESFLHEIQEAAEKAAALSTRILQYTGQSFAKLESCRMNDVLNSLLDRIKPSLPASVGLEADLATGLPAIHGEPKQLEEALMNLMVNAVEALTEAGGTIRAGTGRTHCDRKSLDQALSMDDIEPGPYVYTAIADNGPGMDREKLEKIFDPFYTTKFMGRGLGLSAALGIIKAHGGAITVDSTPGKGTEFRILLPASETEV